MSNVLPEPDPALVAIAVLTRSFLKRLSKKERAAFMADNTEAFEKMEALAEIIRIRPGDQDDRSAEARRQAAAWWRAASVVIQATL